MFRRSQVITIVECVVDIRRDSPEPISGRKLMKYRLITFTNQTRIRGAVVAAVLSALLYAPVASAPMAEAAPKKGANSADLDLTGSINKDNLPNQ
jgi:hypothetical protein